MKYFGFVSLRDNFWYGYDMKGVYIQDALNLMGDDIVIADNDLFGKLKKTMIVEALRKEGDNNGYY